MGKKKELLDTLADTVGCTYLSDLRQPAYRHEAVYLGRPELLASQ